MITDSTDDVASLADAAIRASEARLRSLAHEDSVAVHFWILTQATSAAREPDFIGRMERLGVELRPDAPFMPFIAGLTELGRRESRGAGDDGPFGEIASLAMRQTLTETVATRSESLFGSSVFELQQALARYSTRQQFGVLSRSFFGHFFAGTLKYFVGRELSNRVGVQGGPANVERSRRFSEALERYTYSAARIMEDFAAGWYSKHLWTSEGNISRDEARRFVAVALRKFRGELRLERVEP